MSHSISARCSFALLLTALAAASATLSTTAAHAVDTPFNVAPFTGSSANPNDGVRQVFGGLENQMPGFDKAADRFVFNGAAFTAISGLSFFNGEAADIPLGANLIVLRSTDNDNNPATPFGAGNAATLIANAVTTDGAGFFVYHNSGLNVNRLVYSTNLNLATGDLSILARITNPTGQAAIDGMADFSGANFALAPVPEPGTWALMAAGLLGVVAIKRRR